MKYSNILGIGLISLCLQSLVTVSANTKLVGGMHDLDAYRNATIDIKNSLQKNPNDAEARRRLGLVYLEWGDSPAAEKELRQAIELGAVGEALQIPLAESLLMQAKYQGILDLMLPLALLSAPDRATLLAYRGEAWFGLHRPEKAQDEYQSALRTDPKCVLARLGLARLAQDRQQFDEARRWVTEALALAPDEAKAWGLQGSLFETDRQWEQAEASYSKAIELRRFSPLELASRAIVRANLNKLPAALDDLKTLKQAVPEFLPTLYAEGVVYLRAGDYPAAQTALERALLMNDKFNSLNYYLGIAHLYQQHAYEAEKYFKAFSAYQPEVVEARLFLAALRLQKQDYTEAKVYLAGVLAKQPNNPYALKMMSELEIRNGQREAGLEYLRKFSEAQAAGRAVQPGLGSELWETLREEDILARLAVAPKTLDASLSQGLASLVMRYLRANQSDQAWRIINLVKAKRPDAELGDTLAGFALLAQQAPDLARQSFMAALAKKPGDPGLSRQLAQLALADHQPELARKFYSDALALHPKHLGLRMWLAEVEGVEGKTHDLENQLLAIVKDYPTELEPRLTLAAHWLNSGQAGRAQALLEDVSQGYVHNPAFQILLIKTQLDNQQPSQALISAQRLVKDQPRSAMAHYLLARGYAGRRESEHARHALEQAIALDPAFLPAHYALIRQWALEGALPQATAALAALERDYPNNFEVHALKGWLAAHDHKPKEAVAAYRAAWNLTKNPETVTALAQALWRAGEQDGAIALLEEWSGAHPGDVVPRLALADFHSAQGQTAPALRHVQELARIVPDQPLILNNLAWLYRHSDPDKALASARRAAYLDPRSPTVLDTLAMVELDHHQIDKAVELLTRAARLAPKHKPIQYHLAQALAQQGHTAEAVRLLKALVDDPREFPEQAAAKDLLAQLAAR